MRIAVDMDEVLADTHGAKLAFLRDRFGYDWTNDQMQGVKLQSLADPEHAEALEAHMQEGAFFGKLDAIDGAEAGLRALAQDHEVFIATAALEYPASCGHKIEWMARHFPFIDPMNITLCGDKSIIRADVLIDDSPKHIDRFQGAFVLFSANHNRGFDHPYRLDGWAQAPDLISRLGKEGHPA